MALAGLLVALLAVLVSIVSFEVNRRSARDAERHGRMPVLISIPTAAAICVRNIGNGPAFNVVVARGTGELADVDALALAVRQLGKQDSWTRHMHLLPLAAVAEQCYEWEWGQTRVIGLTYTDALGHPYTVISSVHGTKMVDGFTIPHPPFKDLTYPRPVDART